MLTVPVRTGHVAVRTGHVAGPYDDVAGPYDDMWQSQAVTRGTQIWRFGRTIGPIPR
jgi:hypothetical protein